MWVCRLQLKHRDCPIVNRCEKFKTIVLTYPATWYEEEGDKFSTNMSFFQSGDDSQKQKFLKDLESDDRIVNLNISSDTFTYEINLGNKGQHVMLYQSRKIFFVKPTINHYDGFEYWEIASWEKKEIQEFIKNLEQNMDFFKLLKMEKTNLSEVYFPNIMPNLSKGQKDAIRLAYLNGYYSYPRKITLEELAKMSGISLSTFQEHLRKAEMKLLPSLLNDRSNQ